MKKIFFLAIIIFALSANAQGQRKTAGSKGSYIWTGFGRKSPVTIDELNYKLADNALPDR